MKSPIANALAFAASAATLLALAGSGASVHTAAVSPAVISFMSPRSTNAGGALSNLDSAVSQEEGQRDGNTSAANHTSPLGWAWGSGVAANEIKNDYQREMQRSQISVAQPSAEEETNHSSVVAESSVGLNEAASSGGDGAGSSSSSPPFSSITSLTTKAFALCLAVGGATLTRALVIINRPVGEVVPAEAFDSFGHHWESLYALWPSLLFMVMFFSLKNLCKHFVFPPVARLCGIKGKAVPKFSYQGWLLLFYVSSSVYGHFTLRDKPWVSYPLGEREREAIDAAWRTVPHTEIGWYYSYQIGFFAAELYAIFTEPRRSDFYEYLAHHIVTLYLIIFSWAGYETRIGSYVLIIHDIVDIFLCLAKLTNYMKTRDSIMIPTFLAFVASYSYFRMYCLPMLSIGLFGKTLGDHPAISSAMLLYMLAFALQGLHVFWFYLILRTIYRLVFMGVRNDIRSDNEDDADGHRKANPKKAKAAAAAQSQNHNQKKPKRE